MEEAWEPVANRDSAAVTDDCIKAMQAGMCERTLRPSHIYITRLDPVVIGASGYSDDITISSWTLTRYRDLQ